MLNKIKKMFGLTKQQRKKAELPQGLVELQVVNAKGWWN